MIRQWIATRRLTKRALKVCDGVIAIANNEMLIHGTYVTKSVVSPKLKKQGAICGGRAACLVGSMYLSHGDMPTKSKSDGSKTWEGIFSERRYDYIGQRPALALAYDAFNQAAHDIVDREYSEWSDSEPSAGPYMDWAEFYFEEIIGNQRGYADEKVTNDGEAMRTPYTETREEIIRVAENAKELIKTGTVTA